MNLPDRRKSYFRRFKSPFRPVIVFSPCKTTVPLPGSIAENARSKSATPMILEHPVKILVQRNVIDPITFIRHRRVVNCR